MLVSYDKKVVFVIAQDSCSYCMDNEPVLEKVFKENKDIEVVYVFENSSVEGIKTYYKDLGLELPKNVWIDDNNDLVSEFNLKKTPTMVFVDESNKVSYVQYCKEVSSEPDYEAALSAVK